eukprot:m.31335 g.31335  ORF g.31335 m.31335 type:complete len:81 (+) comp31485_c0_seq2:224-466(+)
MRTVVTPSKWKNSQHDANDASPPGKAVGFGYKHKLEEHVSECVIPKQRRQRDDNEDNETKLTEPMMEINLRTPFSTFADI